MDKDTRVWTRQHCDTICKIVVDRLGVPIDGRAALSDHERRRVEELVLLNAIDNDKDERKPFLTRYEGSRITFYHNLKMNKNKNIGEDTLQH
ncbi:ATPase subunit [Trifolium repens]|nr:ATPase subunit [Trifolium repens]